VLENNAIQSIYLLVHVALNEGLEPTFFEEED
jgi:hypothetical protein